MIRASVWRHTERNAPGGSRTPTSEMLSLRAKLRWLSGREMWKRFFASKSLESRIASVRDL